MKRMRQDSSSAINRWFISLGIDSLPCGWNKISFNDVVLQSQYGLSENTGTIGPYPFIKMNNIVDGDLRLDNTDEIYVSKKDYDDYRLVVGDFLVNRTNSIALVGKACVWDKEEKAFAASYLIRFKISNRANPYFINYWWQTNYAKHRLSSLATVGVQQCNINQNELKKMLFIPLPGRNEQDKIVNIIDKWGRTIKLLDSLILEKRAQRKYLAQQLLTGEIRLPGFKKDWPTVHLGEVFTSRVETDREGLPLIAITGENGVVSREEVGRKDTSSEDKSRYLRIAPGDIGYNTMRMWQGVCGLSAMEGIVSPAYTIVTPKASVDGEFMALFFKLPATIHLFYRHSQGLVDDTLNLKWKHFAQIKVTIPEKAEQKAIAGVFRSFDRELDLLRKQLDSLREQKKGLMQQLLTGKVRVTA